MRLRPKVSALERVVARVERLEAIASLDTNLPRIFGRQYDHNRVLHAASSLWKLVCAIRSQLAIHLHRADDAHGRSARAKFPSSAIAAL
jgi:hypothetical protein